MIALLTIYTSIPFQYIHMIQLYMHLHIIQLYMQSKQDILYAKVLNKDGVNRAPKNVKQTK